MSRPATAVLVALLDALLGVVAVLLPIACAAPLPPRATAAGARP